MEAVFKSWVTTLFGLALWGIAVYEMFFNPDSEMEPWQFGLMIMSGFALLWMRDKISEWINTFVANKNKPKE